MFQSLILHSSIPLLQFQSSPSNSQRRPLAAVQRRHETAVSENLQIPPTSLYKVLRVNYDASLTEIKMAYRNLAKIYHPDSSDGSDGRNFIEICNAYETLSDPASRAVYDVSIGLCVRADRFTEAPFVCCSDSGIGHIRSEFYTTRRWETDQCW